MSWLGNFKTSQEVGHRRIRRNEKKEKRREGERHKEEKGNQRGPRYKTLSTQRQSDRSTVTLYGCFPKTTAAATPKKCSMHPAVDRESQSCEP